MCGSPVVAHHSYGGYDMARVVEIQGAIEEFEWIAPHSLLKVRAEDGRLYTAQWQAPRVLQRRGVARDTLNKGERIVMTGNPRRDFDDSKIMNFKSVRRPAGGWQWPTQ
jgi:uncharacterized protein DUF6152